MNISEIVSTRWLGNTSGIPVVGSIFIKSSE